MSERTAEYTLVPAISAELRPFFGFAIPFFYWTSREGTSLSRECGPREPVRLVAVFARRPKLRAPEDAEIRVRINDELFAFAAISAQAGIPVFAGVPLVRSLFDPRPERRCLWLKICARGDVAGPTELCFTPDGGIGKGTLLPTSGLRGPLAAADIARFSEREAHPRSWGDGLDAIRQVRAQARDGGGGAVWFGAGYRPFHVALGMGVGPVG
ncbi:MAG: hypothetical protein V4850_30560 [Myxococcota bacterium]